MKKYYITCRKFIQNKGWDDWLNIGIIRSSYPHLIFSSLATAEEKLIELNKLAQMDEDLGIHYEYKIVEQEYE